MACHPQASRFAVASASIETYRRRWRLLLRRPPSNPSSSNRFPPNDRCTSCEGSRHFASPPATLWKAESSPSLMGLKYVAAQTQPKIFPKPLRSPPLQRDTSSWNSQTATETDSLASDEPNVPKSLAANRVSPTKAGHR